MASNSSGPSSPLGVADAERHAAQFRPVWDVDEGAIAEEETPAAGTPVAAPASPAAPAPMAATPAVAVPASKPTMRWAPGAPGMPGAPAPVAATQVSPAFVPPAPVVTAPVAQMPPPAPAPAPRGKKPRAEAPTPEMLDLAGDEAPQISSDGSVALAVVTGPVAVPKASNVSRQPDEPSIVVNDVATMARELAAEMRTQEESDSRRRQTVRADDPALAGLQQQYEQQQEAARQQAAQQKATQPANRALRAARTIAPSAGLTSSMVRAAAAPLPSASTGDDIDEAAFAPPKKNRLIVFGVLGVAGLVALLGVVKVALSGDEPASGLPTTTATEAKPADKGTAPTDATATATTTTTAPVATQAAPAVTTNRPTPTLKPSQLPADTTPTATAVAATPKKTGGTTAAAPATAAPTTATKKGTDKGPLVRTSPF